MPQASHFCFLGISKTKIRLTAVVLNLRCTFESPAGLSKTCPSNFTCRDSGLEELGGEPRLRTPQVILTCDCSCDWRTRAGGCDRCTQRGREELPHVQGQGQKPGGPHARRAAAKRSYPTSEFRDGGRECQASTVQEQPRGVTPRLRPETLAGRSNHTSKESWLRGSRRA